MGRDDVGVARVLRLEIGDFLPDHIAFQRRLAIHQRGHDVAIARLLVFEDHGIAFEDAGVDHRVPAHLQREGARTAGDFEGFEIDCHKAVVFLLLVGREAGGDHAVERNLCHAFREPVHRFGAFLETGQRDRARLPIAATDRPFFLQRPEVIGDRIGAGEAEMPLDFPGGRGEPRRALGLLDEVENLLLSRREMHTVHLYSIKCVRRGKKKNLGEWSSREKYVHAEFIHQGGKRF